MTTLKHKLDKLESFQKFKETMTKNIIPMAVTVDQVAIVSKITENFIDVLHKNDTLENSTIIEDPNGTTDVTESMSNVSQENEENLYSDYEGTSSNIDTTETVTSYKDYVTEQLTVTKLQEVLTKEEKESVFKIFNILTQEHNPYKEMEGLSTNYYNMDVTEKLENANTYENNFVPSSSTENIFTTFSISTNRKPVTQNTEIIDQSINVMKTSKPIFEKNSFTNNKSVEIVSHSETGFTKPIFYSSKINSTSLSKLQSNNTKIKDFSENDSSAQLSTTKYKHSTTTEKYLNQSNNIPNDTISDQNIINKSSLNTSTNYTINDSINQQNQKVNLTKNVIYSLTERTTSSNVTKDIETHPITDYNVSSIISHEINNSSNQTTIDLMDIDKKYVQQLSMQAASSDIKLSTTEKAVTFLPVKESLNDTNKTNFTEKQTNIKNTESQTPVNLTSDMNINKNISLNKFNESLLEISDIDSEENGEDAINSVDQIILFYLNEQFSSNSETSSQLNLPRPIKVKKIEETNYETEFNSTEELLSSREVQDQQKDVDDAAEYGLKQMNELFDVLEPKWYKMGLWLEKDNPARFVADFNAQSEQAKKLAKHGYAALQTATKLNELFNIDDGESRSELTSTFPRLRASVRRSPLHTTCPLRGLPRCAPASSRYRTADGTCNNNINPWQGAAMQPMARFILPQYQDGLQIPRRPVLSPQGRLPSPRVISTRIHADRDIPLSVITHMLMQWGQFLDHDLTQAAQSRGFNGSNPRCCRNGGRGFQPKDLTHPDCMAIEVPNDDWFLAPLGIRCMEFVRSMPTSRIDCEIGWREQINQVTAYLDGSHIYGNSVDQADSLRTFRNGQLAYGKTFEPASRDQNTLDACERGALSSTCFAAGDGRVGEQPGLTAMHSTFARLHNLIAAALIRHNTRWSDERLYQETRRIVGAIIQHITYREFLPIVLGQEVMELFDLVLLKKGYYENYSDRVNPGTANAFSAAAFRFGHSLVQPSFVRSDRHHRFIPNNVSIHEEQNNPINIWSDGSTSRILLGMCNQQSQKRDEFITEELTNHLFQTSRFSFGMDLASINIQRGRDHGLPSYTSWREPCGLSKVNSWDDLRNIFTSETHFRLHSIYEHFDDIDLFTGGLSEKPVKGGLVGPTFACIIAQQFSNLRKGDRFWYENGNFDSSFTPSQLQQIRRMTLSQVLCQSTDNINTIQPFVFLTPDNFRNERLSCQNPILNSFNISPWVEGVANDVDIDRFDNQIDQNVIFNQNIARIKLSNRNKIKLRTEVKHIQTNITKLNHTNSKEVNKIPDFQIRLSNKTRFAQLLNTTSNKPNINIENVLTKTIETNSSKNSSKPTDQIYLRQKNNTFNKITSLKQTLDKEILNLKNLPKLETINTDIFTFSGFNEKSASSHNEFALNDLSSAKPILNNSKKNFTLTTNDTNKHNKDDTLIYYENIAISTFRPLTTPNTKTTKRSTSKPPENKQGSEASDWYDELPTPSRVTIRYPSTRPNHEYIPTTSKYGIHTFQDVVDYSTTRKTLFNGNPYNDLTDIHYDLKPTNKPILENVTYLFNYVKTTTEKYLGNYHNKPHFDNKPNNYFNQQQIDHYRPESSNYKPLNIKPQNDYNQIQHEYNPPHNDFNRPQINLNRPQIDHIKPQIIYNRPQNVYNRPPSNYNRPQSDNNQPENNLNRPQSDLNRPLNDYNRPQSDLNRPLNDYNRPQSDYNRPQNDYNRPQSDYNRPQNDYNRPLNDYNRPQNDYNRPQNDYNRPQNDYNRPQNDYNRPHNDYNRPQSDHNRPQNDYNRPQNTNNPLNEYNKPQSDYNVLQNNYNKPYNDNIPLNSFNRPENGNNRPFNDYNKPHDNKPVNEFSRPPNDYHIKPQQDYNTPQNQYDTLSNNYRPRPIQQLTNEYDQLDIQYDLPIHHRPRPSKRPTSEHDRPTYSYDRPQNSYNKPQQIIVLPENSVHENTFKPQNEFLRPEHPNNTRPIYNVYEKPENDISHTTTLKPTRPISNDDDFFAHTTTTKRYFIKPHYNQTTETAHAFDDFLPTTTKKYWIKPQNTFDNPFEYIDRITTKYPNYNDYTSTHNYHSIRPQNDLDTEYQTTKRPLYRPVFNLYTTKRPVNNVPQYDNEDFNYGVSGNRPEFTMLKPQRPVTYRPFENFDGLIDNNGYRPNYHTTERHPSSQFSHNNLNGYGSNHFDILVPQPRPSSKPFNQNHQNLNIQEHNENDDSIHAVYSQISNPNSNKLTNNNNNDQLYNPNYDKKYLTSLEKVEHKEKPQKLYYISNVLHKYPPDQDPFSSKQEKHGFENTSKNISNLSNFKNQKDSYDEVPSVSNQFSENKLTTREPIYLRVPPNYQRMRENTDYMKISTSELKKSIIRNNISDAAL